MQCCNCVFNEGLKPSRAVDVFSFSAVTAGEYTCNYLMLISRPLLTSPYLVSDSEELGEDAPVPAASAIHLILAMLGPQGG